MKMNVFIRTAALMAVAAVSTPAFAGGMTIADDGESKLKLEATVFMNTTDYKKTVNGAVKKHTRSTSLDRAYLGIKYYFDDNWMMRVTYDVNNEPKATSGLGKSQNVFLKYAYLEGKLAGKAAVLRLGQSHTPWIAYEQGLWKHRYVSKVMSDEYKFDSSSELGIGLKGKTEFVNYFVTVTDGNSYSSAANNKSGGLGTDFNARLGVTPIKGLTLDAQMISGYNGTKTLATNNAGGVGSTKQAFSQFMVTYGMGHDFRLGANYLNNKFTPTGGVATTTKGYGVWGWAKVTDGLDLFARLENVKDNKAAAQKKDRTVIGLQFSPRKHVSFSLASDQLKVTNLGNIAGKTEKVSRVGIYSQFKF